MSSIKAVFLDRDGVINLDKGYTYLWEEFEFLPRAIDAMPSLVLAGYLLVIVTNQSGIARGKYTENQYWELTKKLLDFLKTKGIKINGIYHCPHHVQGKIPDLSFECDCRKPKPGLLLRAAKEHDINMEESVMIGDMLSDIQAARAAGIGETYLVRSGNKDNPLSSNEADFVCDDLFACVKKILTDRIEKHKSHIV